MANESRSLNFYLARSKEALLKYLVQSYNLVKKNIESKDRYKQWVAKEKIEEKETMPLHGYMANSRETPSKRRCWDWLTGGNIKWVTEALLVLAQDQTLNTLSVHMIIWNTATSDRWRLCSEGVEKVTHIISGCNMLAQKKYKGRHDKMCSYLHWSLCLNYWFEVDAIW